MNKKYTFLIIPHKSGKKPIEFNLNKWVIISTGILVTILILVFVGTVYYSAKMADISVKYTQMESRNRKILSQLTEYSEKTETLKNTLLGLKEKDQEIRKMLGLRPNTRFFPLTLKKKPLNTDDPLRSALNNILYNLRLVEEYSQAQNKSYDNLNSSVVSLKRDFDRMPSIWPLYGYIVAGFGYRLHPILGIVQMHTGIDIPTFWGAPIRVAASGDVISVGWDGGYGYAAIVDHHNGFRTIYAHLSKFLVKSGDSVKKGQLIALAGSTGLSTGPHLHYEVRYNNTPINPTRYLNLDIFKYSNMLRRAI
ncbi:MAG: M23 family metallopeptidase [Candidatus Margulisbacteria bacterium]|nr:M23 family metallopeptidase [Candidatus Margulisiibacteriota bacterium]